MYTTRRTNTRPNGCGIVGLLVLLLLVGGTVLALGRARNGVGVSVGEHPMLALPSCRGSILIQQGEANQIIFFNVFPIYAQNTAKDIVELTSCDGATIMVPPHTDIKVKTSGSITILGVRGSMNLDVNGDRISLINSTLEGESVIDNNGGLTVFSGDLAPGSTSTFDCNGGSLDVTLPDATAFHLDVGGIDGPTVTNYPEVTASALEAQKGKVDVGQPTSNTTLKLDLNGTTVALHKTE